MARRKNKHFTRRRGGAERIRDNGWLTVEQAVRAICAAVDACDAPEIVLLEELDALAEGWRMRITELEEKDGEA